MPWCKSRRRIRGEEEKRQRRIRRERGRKERRTKVEDDDAVESSRVLGKGVFDTNSNVVEEAVALGGGELGATADACMMAWRANGTEDVAIRAGGGREEIMRRAGRDEEKGR